MTNEETFWHWVLERHKIWYARHVEGLPPPWTDDPYLRAYRWTNVYRRLDPGTAWLCDHVAEGRFDLDASDDEVLLNVLAYRQGLREDSKEHVGWLTIDKAGLSNEAMVRANMNDFGPGHPYTGAYLLGNAGIPGPKRGSWPTLWAMAAATLATRRQNPAAVPWQHLERVDLLKFLRTFQGIGPFVAYQTCLDVSYPENGLSLPHSNDGYALLGPGARRGMDLLTRPFHDGSEADYNERVVWLRDRQDDNLAGKMPGWDHGALDYVYLDRSDVENCLCEYGRYDQARRTQGQNMRRRYQVAT